MKGPTSNELQLQIQQRLIDELSNQQQEFQTHLRLLEEVVFRCKPDGELALLNPAWTKLIGWQVNESIGKSFVDFLAPEECRRSLSMKLRDETAIACDIRLATLFGDIRTFRLQAQRKTDWYGSLQDVTELTNVITALEASEEHGKKLSQVASRTDNLVVITDPNGCIEWVNESFEITTGYELAEVIGQKPGTLLQGPDTNPKVIEEMTEGLRERRGFAVEVINYTKAGQPYWVSIDCSAVQDEHGNILNFIAIERDISDKKQAEHLLRESERHHRHVLNSVSEPIFRCDTSLNLTFVNDAWRRLIGGNDFSFSGSLLLNYVDRPDRQLVIQAAQKAIHSGEPIRQKLQMRIAGNRCRRVEFVLSSTPSHKSEEEGAITGAIIDMEEHWQITQAIKQAKDKAEELSQARTRFVANMSHEIRTPLNAIIGMTSVLDNSSLSDHQQMCLDTIRSGGEALLAVVNDILDFAKLDQNDIELEESEFTWESLFEEVTDLMAEEITRKDILFSVTCLSAIPAKLYGDLHRLRQVLLNLVANALKFTEQGQIDIRTDWRSNNDRGDGQLIFDVVDTGLGIPSHRLKNLFVPFNQGDASTTRHYGGTGLGLAICRQICEKMGGTIAVSSQQNQGTTMRVSVPMKACYKTQPSPEATSVSISRSHPRLISATRSLANLLHVPLNQSENGEVSQQLTLGLNDHTERSHTYDALPTILTPRRLLRQLQIKQKREVPQSERCRLAKDSRLLIVEDSPANQLVIQTMLNQLGYRNIQVVNDGAQALAFLESNVVDLIFMDIHMPVMDGITATRKIRNAAHLEQPAICALTADVTKEAINEVHAAGIDAWASKPLTRNVLINALNAISQHKTEPTLG